ncbi:adenosine deaminase [Legionella geestiana]|uniref:adenosine deaminase n=1 Tax=Legionella geestiana TaxID=45065 RepID=UPI001091B24B|nr:adenosine deaminase [Legionella geestiana]QDQ39812.1 adenosine deaminase [Legionella geestiana]
MKNIPKAELHVHLEGTISPDLARRLAARNQLSLPENLISQDGTSWLSNDFLHFLGVYDAVAAVIKAPRDYYDITLDYLQASSAEGVIYTEMMYSPTHAEMSSGIPSREHLAAIQQAVDDAEARFGITGRIIVTAVRHFGAEAAERVAREGVENREACVTGFGLGGDEAGFPPHLFTKAYAIAHEGGLACTVHAGEFAGAEGMNEAMDTLPIRRIGHGVRAYCSPETIARLKDLDIALELCPTSNVFLGLFKDLESHPFPALMKSGIKVSLNSDDPPFMRTTVGNEYAIAEKVFGFSESTLCAITTMALEAAFVDEATRARLLSKVAA